MSSFTYPSVSDFQTYFFRDFPYTTDPTDLTKVGSQDIMNAFATADAYFNQGLFCDQPTFTLGYLLLAAHCLVMNLRASSQGIAGQFEWLASNKSVGSVSQATSIPQRILDNPEYAYLSKTTYGTNFLVMVMPLLSGQIFGVCGGTRA
jgi:hypothetical protein